MKQVIRKGLSEIIVDEIPAPTVRPHHVLVQPAFSLISSGTETASIHKEGVLRAVAEKPSHIRTVLDAMKTNGPTRTLSEVAAKFREYAVLGYSGAGWVIDKHPTVTDLAIGDRVTYGGEGTGHGEVIMTGRNLVARVPETVSLELASFATLGSIAMNAVRNARLSLGDTVVVLGLGLIGQLTAQLARLQGGRVIAVDLAPDRVELASRLGAHHALVGGETLPQDILALTEGVGADCVLITAGAKSAVPCEQAVRVCRERGRIVVVGAVEMSFPRDEMYLKDIQLYMARAYGPGSYDRAYEQGGQDYPLPYVRWTENRNMEEFLRLIADEALRLDPLITHRFDFHDAATAYDTIMDRSAQSLAVVLKYPSPPPATSPDGASPAEAAHPLLERTVRIPGRQAGERLQFALIGAGNIARWAHMPALRRSGKAQLRAVHSNGGARGKSYALRFGASYTTSDLEVLLADSDIDAVVIASRNQEHAGQALAALRAGKHVFVEKPMAVTEQECRELCMAASEGDALLMVGFNRRFAPYYVEVKKRIRNRQGPVVINCRVNSPGISGGYWMTDPASGGAIVGEGCHFVDLFAFLLDAEPEVVSAFSLPTETPEPIGENNLTASIRFSDGSVANLTYCTVGSRTSGGERLEVFAPGIAIVTEDFRRIAIRGTVARSHSKLFAEKGYDAQFAAFCDAIGRGGPSPVSALDGARATIMCLRMLESARAGMPRPVDWRAVVT